MTEEKKALKTLHFFMVIGMFMFFLVCVLMFKPYRIDNFTFDMPIVSIVVLALVVMLWVYVYVFHRKKIQRKNLQKANSQNIAEYRSLKIIEWAMLEACTILPAIIHFVIDDNSYLLMAAVISSLMFAISRPVFELE